jgi:hypothetical protein
MICIIPCYDEFDHNFIRATSNSSIACCLSHATPSNLRDKYEREFANNPSYVEMYRRGNAYHGAHPFFMCIGAKTAVSTFGKVIAAGAENAHVPAMLGWERADNLTEAVAMARNIMGNSAEITMLHQPMIGIADME